MKKYIARIIIETTTPLVVGSGKSALDNDSVVAKDFNHLPYIPGTGLTGIISSLFEKKYDEKTKIDIFGGEDEESKKDNETFLGSAFEISDALLAGKENKVIQEVVSENSLSENRLLVFFKNYLRLPKREHVRIDHKGTSAEGGKFDSEFVYKGSRFKFEIELTEKEKDFSGYWKDILEIIQSGDFMLGSGTTNNYGQVKVVEIKQKVFDLNNEEELKNYLNVTVDLNKDNDLKPVELNEQDGTWEQEYSLKLHSNALHIGAGYGDNDTDATNYKELVVEWDNNVPEFKWHYVIPGTSIKGVLAHRTAYHFNKNNKQTVQELIAGYSDRQKKKLEKEIDDFFSDIEEKINDILQQDIDEQEKIEKIKLLKQEAESFHIENDKKQSIQLDEYTGENIEVLRKLFGYAKDNEDGQMGNVMIEDCYLKPEEVEETIFQHNAIDRFTGGTIDTALYSEKVIVPKNGIDINIWIRNKDDINAYLKYLNDAVNDLQNADLPIGGKTNKGYGFLTEKQ